MRHRIVRLAVVAAAVAVALFGFPLAVAVVQYAEIYKLLDLERLADRAALRVSADLTDEGDPNAGDLEDEATLTFLSLYDEDGTYLSGRGPELPEAMVRSALDGSVETGSADGLLLVAVPVAHDGEIVGAVRIAGSRDALLWPVTLAWLGMAGLALLAVGVVWGIARREGARLARPLDDLSTAAGRLGDGDFSVRVPTVRYVEIDAVGSALNRTASRLDALLARERAFSAEASHQLRTPLTGLRLGLENALEQRGEDPWLVIARGLCATDRIERTIDELLALARDDRGAADPLDLGRVVQEAVDQWGPQFSAAGRALRIDLQPDTPPALASAAAVRQVLAVLLDNALQHGRGTVEVSSRDVGGGAVAVDVGDHGPGIGVPDSELFTRTGPSSGGHGIGLPLARRLAEAEGGRLRLARPTPPLFTLLLPAGSHH